MMRTGGPSRALNDDNIDIDFLRCGPCELPEPHTAQRVGPESFGLYMDAGKHKFTVVGFDLSHDDQVAGRS